MTIHAVIWDLGGVLVRTEDGEPRNKLAQDLNLTRKQLEDLVFSGDSGNHAQRGEISMEQHWKNVAESLDFSDDEIDEFQQRFWGGDQVDHELVDLILTLKQRYKTGLLSNAFSDLRDIVTNTWQFSNAFDEMIISSEEGVMKPDARIYHSVLEKLDVAPQEAVFIDDFSHNVDGARAVGMQAVHFLNPLQAKAELFEILGIDEYV